MKLKSLIGLLLIICSLPVKAIELRGSKVLVYTKNGKGYVHDNIPSAIACIQIMGREQGFKVDTSSNATIFTAQNLKQ